MKPVIRSFAEANADWIDVKAYNLLDIDWAADVSPPSATPAIALIVPGKKPYTLIGAWEEDELERWVKERTF